MSRPRVERGAHAAHRADEIGEPFEREVLAVQRNQHGVGGDERVEREQPERGRAIDEDVIEPVAKRRDQGAQPLLAVGKRDQLDLGACEIPVGREQRQPVHACRDQEGGRVGCGHGRCQRVVDGSGRRGFPFLADTARQVALGVDVDEQHASADEGEGGGEVDGGCGFADAALLIGDGHDATHFIRLYDLFSCVGVGRWTMAAGASWSPMSEFIVRGRIRGPAGCVNGFVLGACSCGIVPRGTPIVPRWRRRRHAWPCKIELPRTEDWLRVSCTVSNTRNRVSRTDPSAAPERNRNSRPSGLRNVAAASNSGLSSLTARTDTMSAEFLACGLAAISVNDAFSTPASRSARDRTASCRKAAFRALDSIIVSRAAGRAIFSGRAGEPPPDPRSSQTMAVSGTYRAAASGSTNSRSIPRSVNSSS